MRLLSGSVSCASVRLVCARRCAFLSGSERRLFSSSPALKISCSDIPSGTETGVPSATELKDRPACGGAVFCNAEDSRASEISVISETVPVAEIMIPCDEAESRPRRLPVCDSKSICPDSRISSACPSGSWLNTAEVPLIAAVVWLTLMAISPCDDEAISPEINLMLPERISPQRPFWLTSGLN